MQPKIKYQEPPLLFRNLGAKKFENVSNAVGADFTKPLVARGAIYGDFDHDGDLDVLLTSNNGPAHLYRNDGGNKNKWISIRTIGTKSNRDGIGASVAIASASGKQWNVVRSGSSYASQSDLALVFGLGQDPVVNSIEVSVAERNEAEVRQRGRESIHHDRRNSWHCEVRPPPIISGRARCQT